MELWIVILGSLLVGCLFGVISWQRDKKAGEAIAVALVIGTFCSGLFGVMLNEQNVLNQKTQLIATHLDITPGNITYTNDTWFTPDGAYTGVFKNTGVLSPKDVELAQLVKIGNTVK